MGKEDRYNLKDNPISNFQIGLDTHSFNVSLASRFGVVEALIIQHSYYWYKCNKGNEDMTKDGHTWFYRSVSQIADVYPYLSVDKVRRAIDRLVENGILIKGNYNTDKFKKANWYSLSDDMISAMSGDSEELDRQNAKPFGKMPNHSAKCQLNYNKEYNNKENKEERDKSLSKKEDIDFGSIFSAWNEVANDVDEISSIRELTDKRKKQIRTLFKSCNSTCEEFVRFIKTIPYADDWVIGKGDRKWSIDFDWLIQNTSNWYVAGLEGNMHKKNRYAFDKIMKCDSLSLHTENSDIPKFQ